MMLKRALKAGVVALAAGALFAGPAQAEPAAQKLPIDPYNWCGHDSHIELDGHIFKFYDHWHEANRHVHYYWFRNIASGFSTTHLGHC
ncbi:hypothetical protein [Amycolatopsis magusensis]|uniref:Secreted protein n=1 Tax=Amycolatopsis magusensis TaxID=882444 RepID=A0ABS4PI06_9PSEU|nr:hypothetical protein [Amycolatopsis magusensis]MBP2178550.1 hypothetical protein [Amycolatopsis magusensis]